MACGPASFSDIGKKAKEFFPYCIGHLSRDCKAEKEIRMEWKVKSTGVNTTASNTPVNDHSGYKGLMFPVRERPIDQGLQLRSQVYPVTAELYRAGNGLTATGLRRDQIFFGDISTLYKSGNTTVDVKVDTYSNVSTKVTVSDILPSTKAAFSFKIPDHKSGKLDVQYLHPHAAIDSSIGLNPTPLLELSAAIGSKDLSLGGEVGFDTASASFNKYNAGIGLNKPDYSAALLLTDKGQTLKASYVHFVNPVNGTAVAAEMTHRFSTNENSFTIGSSHALDPLTVVKTRFSDNGKVAMLCQREWRPKSLITFSAEYDSKANNVAPKLGLALALKP